MLEALGQLANEGEGTGQLRRLLQLGLAGIGAADADVVGDGAGEQHALLQHHAHVAAQGDGVGDGEIHVVHQYLAVLGHIEPLQQTGQGALAAAGRTRDADELPRFNGEGEVGQHLGASGW